MELLLERISIKKKSRGIRYNYKDTFCFAVAGTMVTTTSSIGHILYSGVDAGGWGIIILI
jgi:hypothetical protein